MTGDEKLLKKGGIDKSKAVFAGAFQPTEEQLTPRKEGEPPSAASMDLIDRWVAVMESHVKKLKEELAAETVLFDEVRQYKHE
jgi:hypothetical protein